MSYVKRVESDRLRVGKILAIGRNYQSHAREMGDKTERTFPIVFMKPSTAIVHDGGQVIPPSSGHELHHELELVAVIGRRMKRVDEDAALAGILGFCVGLDMTLRDLQAEAKKRGEPWTVAKGFDSSAPLGDMVSLEKAGDWKNAAMTLNVNGDVRQQGSVGEMIFPVPALIAQLSTFFTLEPGDLIYTGTPEGVGAVQEGDRLEARIDGLPSLSVTIG